MKEFTRTIKRREWKYVVGDEVRKEWFPYYMSRKLITRDFQDRGINADIIGYTGKTDEVVYKMDLSTFLKYAEQEEYRNDDN